MPTGGDDVRSGGWTGSGWPTVKPTRLTQRRHGCVVRQWLSWLSMCPT